MLRPHPQYPHFNVGRKGSVIYYAWHNIQCARSYTKPHNPRTQSQQANRNLHGRLTRLSGETKAFRQFCFDGLSSYRSSHTAFIGIQLAQLRQSRMSTDLPMEAKIHWGRGSLPGATQMTFSWKENPILKWECDQRKLTRKTDQENKVLWIVWNAHRHSWHWILNGSKRRDKSSLMNLPKEWKKEELFIWLLFYDTSKRRFSCDTCLHVKGGNDKASCFIVTPTLFTKQGHPFADLVRFWDYSRTLERDTRKAYREEYFT